MKAHHAANQACKTISFSAEFSFPIHRRATANLSTLVSTRSAMNFEGDQGSHEFERDERSIPLTWSPVACLTWIAIRAIPNPTRQYWRSAAKLVDPILILGPT